MAANSQRWTWNKCVSFGTRPGVCVVYADALERCSALGFRQRERDFMSVVDLSMYFDVFRPGRPARPPAARPLPPLSVSADGSCCSGVRSQLCEAYDMLHSGKGLHPNVCMCLCVHVCVSLHVCVSPRHSVYSQISVHLVLL